MLGTALAIKMSAYILVAPVAAAFADKFPRRTMLVTLDLVRALVAITLPFVTQIWEIYILIFILQAASAAFTPTFQATIPDILPDEREYTRALSLSRLAYDLESVISPMLAAALLTVMSFHNLFAGTAVGFLASAALVVSVTLPKMKALTVKRSIYDKTTRGMRIFLKTPRLRGLLALNMAVAAASAMVIVNTVVLVQADFGFSQRSTAIALAFFGVGSMVSALVLPRLLDNMSDRMPMLAGTALLVIRVRHFPEGLHHAGCALGTAGGGLFTFSDTGWSPAAPFVNSGRQTGAVCRPVCTVTFMLAGDLSAGRMGWCGMGDTGFIHRPDCCGNIVAGHRRTYLAS
ncbi:mef(A)_10_AF376746 [Klebsiella pneumoniae]|nr:mef(A)_10_AF376746 [Klebsiella pneumoniae]